MIKYKHMDYQKEQIKDGVERGFFDSDKNVEVAADRNLQAIGNRSLEVGNAEGRISEAPNGVGIGGGTVEMLTPVDMGLTVKKEDVKSGEYGGGQIDFEVISNGRGDQLSKNAVEQIEGREKELNRDGDVEGFYDDFTRMRGALLRNNYGREIGEKVV